MNNDALQAMRQYADSSATVSYTFRLMQLKVFKQALIAHEKEIYAALYTDLRKNETTAFLTEYGLVLAEVKLAIKKLEQWMRPRRVKTAMINFPSTSWIYPYPKGVVLVIGTWNYPILLTLTPLVGAIAGGNSIVLKPSEHAPATAAVIAKIISTTFLPNYIRVVMGDGGKVVPELMNHFRFDHIFFTGGGRVGKELYMAAAKALIPVTLELGGKSPAVVEQDANIAIAARRIVFGKFINAGQTCVAPDYILVHRDVQDALVDALRAAIRIAFGENSQHSNDFARIINSNRFNTLVSLLEQSRTQIVHGGKYDAEDLYIEPTVLNNVSKEAPLMQEEIFGPLLPIIPFRSQQEALEIIAQHPNPLAFYLFTSNKKKEEDWLSRVNFGGGCINNAIQHLGNPHLPYGGVGQSGTGAYRGKYSFKTFTHDRAVLKTPRWLDLTIKYPPYRGALKWLRKFY